MLYVVWDGGGGGGGGVFMSPPTWYNDVLQGDQW